MRRDTVCLGAAVAVVVAATVWPVGPYAAVLFWVRALQVVLLLYVAPFLFAMARPVTALQTLAGPRIDRVLASRAGRIVLHPATTSLAMLATPWLLYLTPWYVAALRNPWVGALTDAALLAIGFSYFYARLQRDPVPRRYPQSVSLLISVAESLGDGLLGLVIWLGPLIGADYYAAVDRQWGPSQRVDQSIGAGVLWLVGDVLGLVFVIVLMRIFTADEQAEAQVIDTELDDAPATGMWWENDPQLRDRMGRR